MMVIPVVIGALGTVTKGVVLEDLVIIINAKGQQSRQFCRFSFFCRLLLLLLLLFESFVFTPAKSHWSLSDSKSPQVSRTLRILTDLNNVAFWMVSYYIYIYVCVCVCVSLLIDIIGNNNKRTHTHTHTHIYIYIYIHKINLNRESEIFY